MLINKYIRFGLRKIKIFIYKRITLISPLLNTKLHYWDIYHKKLNLKNPQTFIEKLQYLKVYKYNNNPLVKKCADKYRVRSYITECGYSDILVPIIALYDDINSINWKELPNSFAMKWNYGCGYNIICSNKNLLDFNILSERLIQWKKEKQYLEYAEMQYKLDPSEKKIIVEKYLTSSNGLYPEDYKVYCFNGNATVILYIDDRGTTHTHAGFFDLDWNFIAETGKNSYTPFNHVVKAPACLKKMIAVSNKLSRPFEFVRVDFYVVDGFLYFGEMTFTPAAGLYTSQCIVNGKTMGELLKVEII